jgi:hypothetical protein
VGKVGGLQKIPQICELVRIRKCGHLRICDLRTKCFWQFADLRFADPVIFAYLKLPQIRKYIIYLLTNKSLKALIQIQGRLSGQFWDTVTWYSVPAFSLQICGFAICEMVHFRDLRICRLIIKNLRICDLRTGTPQKLRICDCGMNPRICGFAICEPTKIICLSTFG